MSGSFDSLALSLSPFDTLWATLRLLEGSRDELAQDRHSVRLLCLTPGFNDSIVYG